MKIWIALTDDWELRGNGTGRVSQLQCKPAARLMDLYERLGIRSTFNVEVMQQLAFERYAQGDAEFRAERDAWKDSVAMMIARGFDVQLHLHPQWLGAERVDGWWRLGTRWNLADYSISELRQMIKAAIDYLRPIIAPHTLVSFRAGSWGIGPPSRALFEVLLENGISLDTSVVNGSYYDGEGIKLDYTNLDSPNLAYRPELDDGRRIARGTGGDGIIEIPTQSVRRSELFGRVLRDIVGGSPIAGLAAAAQLASNSQLGLKAKSAIRSALRKKTTSAPSFVMQDPFGFLSGKAKTDVIFDLSSSLPTLTFIRMADICIQRARRVSGREIVVLIIENHTKDLQRDSDFARIEAIISHIQCRYPDATFHKMSEVQRVASLLV